MKIELTLDEINRVLFALGKMPYEQVFELIPKITNQAEAQVKAQNKSIVPPPQPMKVEEQ